VLVDDEERALLQAFAEHRVGQAPVHADGHRLSQEGANQADTLVVLPLLAELVTLLDREPTLRRERLDRLDAAVVRARKDPRDRVALELLDERGRAACPRPRSSSGRFRSSPFQSSRCPARA
jgi:hypothetical protein